MSRAACRAAPCCVTLLSLLALAGAAGAQTHSCVPPLNLSCGVLSCRAPASGAPAELWGELRPVDTGILPAARDTTSWNEYSPIASVSTPRWMSLDIENGFLFAAVNWGFQVWSLASPTSPVLLAATGSNKFPRWIADPHEGHPVRDIDAPPGEDDVVAVTVTSQGGLAIFDTSNKSGSGVVARYADTGKTAVEVYAGRVAGNAYAFTATRDAGLLVHDMTAAENLSSLCVEDTPSQQSCGVYVGRLGSRDAVSYVDGAGDAAGTSLWVVFSSGGNPDGFEIWDLSNPASPQLEIVALTASPVHGVALWRSGSSYYLGLRLSAAGGTEARIYDVSCIAAGSCGALGAPLWSQGLPADVGEYFVTDSATGGRTFLYFGSSNKCYQGLQGEWLFDVTNPAQAYDVTPPAQLVEVFGNPELTGYWGWYYRRNSTGYNRINPRMGKFDGVYFYRAAYSVFDFHELTSGSVPAAAFTYTPAAVYRDQPVGFSDGSLGAPSSWDWTFAGGVPASSAAQNPGGVVFPSTGAKQVSLTVTNAVGSDSTSQTVDVLDPAAQVASVSASPDPALVCQPVTFLAEGASGLPPLAFSWQVRASGGALVASGGDVNPFVWDTTAEAPGDYTATVTVSNAEGVDSADSPAVSVENLPPLAITSPGAAPETLNGPPFGSGEVDFLLQASGATEWRWSFGDGTPPAWTSDPASGPAPVHVYAAAGDHPVSVDVRNCQEGPLTSQTTTVTIDDTSPLVAQFDAQGLFCTGLGCFADAGVAIPFTDSSQGNPGLWDYDWDGDGTFEDPGHPSPVTSHTYWVNGTYAPALRIWRASAEDTYVHGDIIVGGGSPAVDVSGPDAGQVSASLSLTAAAVNCSPLPTAWSWNVGSGGSIDGPANGATVAVTYATAGAKTVQATAADGGCSGTSGSKGVMIYDASLVFADGFESGDTSSWSPQIP